MNMEIAPKLSRLIGMVMKTDAEETIKFTINKGVKY